MKSQDLAVRSGLSAAAALAASSGAYAAIVPAASLPADVLIPVVPTTTTSPNWDVNGDAINDFVFTYRYPNSATQVRWQANMVRLNSGGGTVAYLGAYSLPYANNLTAGTLVSGASNFLPTGTGAQVILGSVYGSTAYAGFGQLTGSERGFVGFKFSNGADTFYGWADIEVFAATDPGTSPGTVGIRFYSAYYNDAAGQGIDAGAIPAPGALAAMALGAAGLLRRQKRHAA